MKTTLLFFSLLLVKIISAQIKLSPIYEQNGIKIDFQDSILICENDNTNKENTNDFLNSALEIVSFNPVKSGLDQFELENEFHSPPQRILTKEELRKVPNPEQNKKVLSKTSPFNNHDISQFYSRMYVFENVMSKKKLNDLVNKNAKLQGEYQYSERVINNKEFIVLFFKIGKSRIYHYILQKKKYVYWFTSSPYGNKEEIEKIISTIKFIR